MQQSSTYDSLEGSDKKQFWEQCIVCYEQSGLSRRNYCQTNNISYQLFLYWHRNLREKQKTKCVPLTLKSSSMDSQQLCTLELRNGHRLVIHDHTIVDHLLEKFS